MLRGWHIGARHVGYDLFATGVQDESIIPPLQRRRTRFFTRDEDFYRRDWRDPRSCLVYLDGYHDEATLSIRLLLRHPAFNTEAKRLGHVIRVTASGLTFRRLHAEQGERTDWP